MRAEIKEIMTRNDTADNTTTDAEPLIDDQWVEGVYNDGRTGEFVHVDREPNADSAAILHNMDGAKVEQVSPEEWETVQEVLLPVPQRAIEDPVTYIENIIETHAFTTGEMNVGLVYADKMTEVVTNE